MEFTRRQIVSAERVDFARIICLRSPGRVLELPKLSMTLVTLIEIRKNRPAILVVQSWNGS